jgi:hypothetical protein
MLPDYKPNLLFSPLKFRHVHEVRFVADIATGGGAATLRASESSPGVTLTGSGGTYALTFPKGMSLVPDSGFIEKAAAPLTADGSTVSFGTLTASTGTCQVFTLSGVAGTAASPASVTAAVLHVKLKIGKA